MIIHFSGSGPVALHVGTSKRALLIVRPGANALDGEIAKAVSESLAKHADKSEWKQPFFDRPDVRIDKGA